MKRNLVLGTVFSAALAVGASAQAPAAQTGQSSQKQSQQNQQVTVTGCLQSGDMAGGTAGTTGTATSGTTGQATGSSSSRNEFMLTNAKITSGGSGMAGTTGTGTGTGTSGTAGTSASSMMNKFKLTGGNQQELKEYLNSEVEIHGTLQRGMSSSSGAAAGTGTGTTAQSHSKMDDNVHTIRVTSVKQTAKTCTGGDR